MKPNLPNYLTDTLSGLSYAVERYVPFMMYLAVRVETVRVVPMLRHEQSTTFITEEIE